MLNRVLVNLSKYHDKQAFCIENTFYSYKMLEQKIAGIQVELENNKITDEGPIVGIICNNDFETYASIFALWFTGMAYVPVSLKIPKGRNLKMLEDAGVKIVLSSTSVPDFEDDEFKFINTSSCLDTVGKPNISGYNEKNLAYILFTSGSTGVPKGVPISQKNLSSFVESFEALDIKLTASDRCLQMFELTFDVSVASFLMPVLNGACVYTMPPEVIKYLHIVRMVRDYNLSFVALVPSVLTLLKPYFNQLVFEGVRCCILTAEATFSDMLPPLQKMMPGADIWNLYGPTEATIWSTGLKYDAGKLKQYNGMFAIGKPLKNVTAIITDEQSNKLGSLQKGELCLSGNQITGGYLNNPQMNAKAFYFDKTDDELLYYYKTGDSCFIDDEEDIHYCGRIDNQVQIQGFRVELSEIEILIREQFDINNVVVARNNKLEVLELVLILENYAQNTDEIRNFITKKLPYYMIPHMIITVDEFPVNNSGKVDRIKLKTIL